jgi:hypothetical protein
MTRALSLTHLAAALLLGGLGASLGSPAFAQSDADRLRALEQRLDASLQLIEKLNQRIAELERAATPAKAKGEAGTPSDAEQARAIDTLRKDVEQISDGLSRNVGHTGVPLHGFADANAGWSGAGDPRRLRGFGVGSLDLYLTPQFGSRVKSLMEIVFEYGPEGTGEFEAERAQVGYTFSDALTLWAGRFHTPIGLWNTLYHHGANLQTSIYRPRFIEFEDRNGLLPTHSVGLWASGKTTIEVGKVNYDVYVSNGPTVRKRLLDFNGFTDDNSGKLVGLNLGIQPAGVLRGLSVGVHAFGATVDTRTAADTVLSRSRMRMSGGYFGYDAKGFEAIGEYYRFANRELASGARHSSTAWFTQVGYSFGGLLPFARYERVSLDSNDMLFSTQQVGRSYTRSSIGARYELDSKSALKIELGDSTEAAATLIDENGASAPVPRARYRRTAVEYSIAF